MLLVCWYASGLVSMFNTTTGKTALEKISAGVAVKKGDSPKELCQVVTPREVKRLIFIRSKLSTLFYQPLLKTLHLLGFQNVEMVDWISNSLQSFVLTTEVTFTEGEHFVVLANCGPEVNHIWCYKNGKITFVRRLCDVNVSGSIENAMAPCFDLVPKLNIRLVLNMRSRLSLEWIRNNFPKLNVISNKTAGTATNLSDAAHWYARWRENPSSVDGLPVTPISWLGMKVTLEGEILLDNTDAGMPLPFSWTSDWVHGKASVAYVQIEGVSHKYTFSETNCIRISVEVDVNCKVKFMYEVKKSPGKPSPNSSKGLKSLLKVPAKLPETTENSELARPAAMAESAVESAATLKSTTSKSDMCNSTASNSATTSATHNLQFTYKTESELKVVIYLHSDVFMVFWSSSTFSDGAIPNMAGPFATAIRFDEVPQICSVTDPDALTDLIDMLDPEATERNDWMLTDISSCEQEYCAIVSCSNRKRKIVMVSYAVSWLLKCALACLDDDHLDFVGPVNIVIPTSFTNKQIQGLYKASKIAGLKISFMREYWAVCNGYALQKVLKNLSYILYIDLSKYEFQMALLKNNVPLVKEVAFRKFSNLSGRMIYHAAKSYNPNVHCTNASREQEDHLEKIVELQNALRDIATGFQDKVKTVLLVGSYRHTPLLEDFLRWSFFSADIITLDKADVRKFAGIGGTKQSV